MATLSEAKKRDFIAQIETLILNEADLLRSKGFDPTERMTSLNQKKEESHQAEIEQQQAAANAQNATKNANQKLDEAYREASNLVDLISGLLGKEDSLVKKMRKFRK